MNFITQNLVPEILVVIIITVSGVLFGKYKKRVEERKEKEKAKEREHQKAIELYNKFSKYITDVSPDQNGFQNLLLEKFRHAKKIEIMVIRGLAIFSLKDSLFYNVLKDKNPNEFNIRILMLDPKSPFVEVRAQEINESKNAVTKGIKYSIGELIEVKDAKNLNLKIKVYDELPIWRLMFFDNSVFVSSFQKGKEGAKLPMYLFEKDNFSQYDVFERYFNYIWNYKSREAAEIDYRNGHQKFTYDDALKLLDDSGCSKDVIWHCKTVARLARDIAEKANKDFSTIDVDMVELGGLLHDIGKSQSDELDHAFIGANIVRMASGLIKDSTLKGKLARIVEVHTGAGLTIDDIKKLNNERKLKIPERNYVPETIEEEIVSFADKLVEGDNDITYEQQLKEKKERFGDDSFVIAKIEDWHQKFKKYME